MAYDEDLANRMRVLFRRRKGVAERKMFGGLCFTINGNMCCGIAGENLVVRLGEKGTTDGLKESNTAPFDLTGKTMKTMLYVLPKGCESEDNLKAWIERAVRFSRSLPVKEKK